MHFIGVLPNESDDYHEQDSGAIGRGGFCAKIDYTWDAEGFEVQREFTYPNEPHEKARE